MPPCYDFSEIASLYKEIKKIVLLAENENDEKAVILSSVNEMRNALDHLMRCYDSSNKDECKKQIDKAKGHLFRAGYDAYELLAMEATTKIKKIFSQFSTETITKVFPQYYTNIYPLISKFEKKLAKARSSKKIGYDFYDEKGEIDVNKIQSAFEDYEKVVEELLKIKDEVISKVPILQQAKKDIRWENIKKIVITVIISGIIGYFIRDGFDYIKNKNSILQKKDKEIGVVQKK